MSTIPAAVRSSILAVSVTIMSTTVTVGGYWWGQYIWKKDNTTQVYVFKGYSNSAVLSKGFACLCKLSGSTPNWKGDGSDTSCNNGGNEKVIRLHGSGWVPASKRSNVEPPDKACCKSKPKVNGVALPNVPEGISCWTK